MGNASDLNCRLCLAGLTNTIELLSLAFKTHFSYLAVGLGKMMMMMLPACRHVRLPYRCSFLLFTSPLVHRSRSRHSWPALTIHYSCIANYTNGFVGRQGGRTWLSLSFSYRCLAGPSVGATTHLTQSSNKKRNVSFEKEAAVAARSDMAAQNRQHSDATISAWIYLLPFVCRLSLSPCNFPFTLP